MGEIISLFERLPAPDGTPVAGQPGLVWWQGVWIYEDAWREIGQVA